MILGTLQKDRLILNEIRRFGNVSTREKDAVLWDAAQLYQEVLAGLRDLGAHHDPVESISCTAWAADYLLFHADASFIPPTYHYRGTRTAAGRQEILSKLGWETIYAETGVRDSSKSTLFQLAAEKSRNFKRADHLMPIADGFNFLLSGVPCVEKSSASATQLFNPVTNTWSAELLNAVKLPASFLPAVVSAGTRLKPLRPELAQATELEDAQITASCSNDLAAALAGLPIEDGENWAFVRLNRTADIGGEISEPVINSSSCAANVSCTLGFQNAAYSHTETFGTQLLEDCRRYWADMDHALDESALAHLAATAEPLESLIDLAEARFAAPGDLVPKMQAFCRETGQTVPRRPGAIYRSLMESIAFLYRRKLDEISRVTGREFNRVYLLGDGSNNILNHFITNALQLPMIVAPSDSVAIGNILVQALGRGRVESMAQARHIVRQSFKLGRVLPHPEGIWAPVYERYLKLCGAQSALALA